MEQAEKPELEVQHEDRGDRGAFYVETDAGRVAELSWSRTSPHAVVLEHTQVSDVLRGRGAGRLLVEAAVAWARRTGTRLVPACAYAKTVFERHPALRDVVE